MNDRNTALFLISPGFLFYTSAAESHHSLPHEHHDLAQFPVTQPNFFSLYPFPFVFMTSAGNDLLLHIYWLAEL